ncbi:unnamed protein product, partial [Mesorhabditis spiculigera]
MLWLSTARDPNPLAMLQMQSGLRENGVWTGHVLFEARDDPCKEKTVLFRTTAAGPQLYSIHGFPLVSCKRVFWMQ